MGYASGSIAGVSLEDGGVPCKTLIVDGANFLSTTTGSSQVAADGTVYVQALTPVGGIGFGVRCEFLPPDVLNDIITAVLAAINADNTFNVTLTDDIHSINTSVVPDFDAGWLRYEAQRTHPDTIKGVDFRFITSS